MEILAGLSALSALAAPAAAAGGTAAAGSAALGASQGGLAALSGFMQLGAGVTQGFMADAQASEQAKAIRREHQLKAGAAKVAFAGSGVMLDSGQPQQVLRGLRRQRDDALEGVATNRRYEIAGAALKTGAGLLRTASDYKIDIAARG